MHDNGGKREREDADGAPEKRARGETLSAGQRRAIEIAAAGKSLALLGPAGTGKSLTVRHIRDALVAKHAAGRVAVTAAAGAAGCGWSWAAVFLSQPLTRSTAARRMARSQDFMERVAKTLSF